LFITLETVAGETPAILAISFIVSFIINLRNPFYKISIFLFIKDSPNIKSIYNNLFLL
jgi:predicted branched-subunit amino acid permease